MGNKSDFWLWGEWHAVKQAPLLFGISVLTLSLLIGGVLYGHFHTNLELRADRIVSLREENDRLRNEIKRLVKLNAIQDTPSKEPPDTNKECPDFCQSSPHTQRM